MEYLIIDGYNVINAWKGIFNLERESLEDCRDKLLSILSNYQGYKKTNIIVVFDAHFVKGSQEKEEFYDNIKIVFTKANESADVYIERFVYKLSSQYRIRVVTSDYLEQTIVLSVGGIRMTPKELLEEMNLTTKSIRTDIARIKREINTVVTNASPEILEKLEKIRRGK